MIPLRQDAVIGQRFVVEAVVGEGGMGRVYRARDLRSGETVALKLPLVAASASAPSPEQVARFEREARLLAHLRHPAIVSFVDSGTTGDGQPFLAMEWLDGVDLAEKISTSPLSAAESLAVVRRVASALALAQTQGVVHRDLKPANIFLRGGAPARATLLDFGIARRVVGASAFGQTLAAASVTATALRTATGVAVGTPHYMAPEQARAEREIGPAVDVFSLGCVAYECLAGRPPFVGEHIAAILAQILFEEPPPLRNLRPDLPQELHALVTSMLAKRPAERPSAADVIEAIDRIGAVDGSQRPQVTARPAGIGRDEQQIASVLLAAVPAPIDDDATMSAEAFTASLPDLEALSRALRPLGAHAERLADHSVVVTFAERSASAADQAEQAARCALILREAWAGAVIAVATGRSAIRDGRATGEALARAGRLLAAGASTPAGDPPSAGRILLEDVTAGLLGPRAQVTRIGHGVSALLGDTLTEIDASRPFLGKPTPCVGREAELGALELALAGCVEDATSRAIVIAGPPGVGKSRLRHELGRRIEARGEAITVVTARAESLRSSLPLGLLGAALRRLCGVVEGAPADEQRAAIRRRAALRAPSEAEVMAEFLGELCDLPFTDGASARLIAARQDPRIMNDRLRGACVDLLRAECEANAVVLLLEDLHWSDRLSLEFIHEALLSLTDSPLLIVAFARPEVFELFPGLWGGKVQEIPLRPLPRRACLRFVQKVAADRLAPAVIERLVERSAGNALFLEELTRAALEGSAEDAPETVLAMLQARLGRLEEGDRRILRAGSIFGHSFPEEGVRALLGPDTAPEELAHSLRALITQEILEPRRDEEGASGRVLRFRHALMREAAYARSTDDDRRVGHRLAASFLSAAAEPPGVIAEHYAESDAPTEAIPYFIRAAERALEHHDTDATRHYARRGRALDPGGERQGILLSLEAAACVWRWEWGEALKLSSEALPLLRVGSKEWCLAQHVRCYDVCYLRPDRERAIEVATRYLATDPEPAAITAYYDFAAHMASALIQTGAADTGLALLRRGRSIGGDAVALQPAIHGWHNLVWCSYHRYTDDDVARQIELASETVALFEQVGATRTMLILAQDVLGELLARAGRLDDALALIRRSIAMIEPKVLVAVQHARMALANVLVEQGTAAAIAEAEALVTAILAAPGVTQGYRAMAGYVVAQAHLARGELDAAVTELEQAIALSRHTHTRRFQMTGTWIRALLRRDDRAAAAAAARDALAELDEVGQGGYGELPLLAAAAEGLLAAGAVEEGLAALRRADDKLARLAAGFEDDAARARFLGHVPLHVHLRELAASWLGASPPGDGDAKDE